MFTFIEDPGHGWLEVTIADLARVNLSPESFSTYSYRHGSTLYLEEDCDAAIFLDAWRATFGGKPEIKSIYTASARIRNLPRIHQST